MNVLLSNSPQWHARASRRPFKACSFEKEVISLTKHVVAQVGKGHDKLTSLNIKMIVTVSLTSSFSYIVQLLSMEEAKQKCTRTDILLMPHALPFLYCSNFHFTTKQLLSCLVHVS